MNEHAVPTRLSAQNPRLARARALHAARERRARDRFLIEGPTLLAEAVRSGLPLEDVFVTDAAAAEAEATLAAVEAAGTPVFLVEPRVLERLSELETPPGIVAVAERREAALAEILARPGPILLLAGINDPGNAGTLLRSAEAFGAAGAIAVRGGVDPWSPKTVRAAMGSLFRLPVAQAAGDEVVAAVRRAGRPIVAADLAGSPLRSTLLPPDAVLAIGHERHGVRAFLPEWDITVRIEQRGSAESLNAAVAGSILLYAVAQP